MELSIVIGVVGTLFGMIIGCFTFTRNRDRDVRSDGAESAVVATKLDAIGRGVESIQVDIKANERRVSDLSERVIRVEESAKQAHKRIDGIEERGTAQ